MRRRDFLAAALLFPALRQPASARYTGTLPLGNPSGLRTAPLGELLGSGLSARLFTDLSTLPPDDPRTLVTSNEKFFVRTAPPRALPDAGRWTIAMGGLVESAAALPLASARGEARPFGPFVMECSGNADPANYGLLSAARWDGIPLLPLLDRVRPSSASHRILVAGVDDPDDPGRTSVPGASWIFTRDDLARAMLATRINGAPLPRDHGAPVRLIVPGWYGCACIKWVDRIDLVPDDAAATTQMREFAARTHQPFDALAIERSFTAGESLMARDFTPAIIDAAAMPVRAEKWAIDGRIVYRIAGIVWGGSKPTNALQIRFRSGMPWVPVDDCPLPPATLTWSTWTHTWRPEAPGRYQIVLRVNDPSIRTRRLDVFFYVREINIDAV